LEGLPIQAAIEGAVEAQGGDTADLSVAFGMTADFQGFIIAVKLAGLDAAGVLPAVLEAVSGSQEATVLAGKNVTQVASEGSTSYIYVKDDVIWWVQGSEPLAIEVFDVLP
jgi:hypothetical protein